MIQARRIALIIALSAVVGGADQPAASDAKTAVDDTQKAEAPKMQSPDLDEPVASKTQTTSAPTSAPAEENIWTRDKLTGDWFGERTKLAELGLTFDLRVTQYFQGVASGGANTNFAYGGNFDFILNIDAHKLGLWEGFFVNVHAENQFGNGISGDAGAFAFPNTTMLYPLPGYRDMAVTQVLATQFLSKNFALFFGKINVVDLWTMVYPETGGGVEGFMNVNMLASALPWLRYVNLSVLGAGALVLTDDGQIQGGVFAFDLNNVTTTTGIPELFDDGAGVLGLWRFFFDVDNKPASLLFAVGGATREYHSFDNHPSGWRNEGIISRIQRAAESKDDGAWTAGVYYEQVLWEEPANDKQNLRFFTGWSASNGDPNFGKWGGFALLEATGLLFGREKDRAGVGAFYSGLSTDFKRAMDRVGVDLRDLWGAEIYYNVEITPWFHLTPNLQVVQNQNKDDDPGVIVGLRGVIDF